MAKAHALGLLWLTRELGVFGFLRVGHRVVQDLSRAYDHVWVLHHFAKEVLLLALSTDGHHSVVTAQVRLELVVVMLVYQVDLNRRSKALHLLSVLLSCYSRFFLSMNPTYHVHQDDHFCVRSGLQVFLSHVNSSSGFSASRRQPDDDVLPLKSPLDNFFLVRIQFKVPHRSRLLLFINAS